MNSLLYAYAVLPAAQPAAAWLEHGSLRGIDGGPVGTVSAGDLAVAVSDVPATAFGEEPLNENLRDMDWLAPRAAAHQEVNAALLERSDALLPLSFGTVYRDVESIRRMLRLRGGELLARLADVRARTEWVVTVARDEDAAVAALERDDPELVGLRQETAASAPGRRYLLERKLAETCRQRLRDQDASVAGAVIEALGELVERSYREPLAASPGGPIARLSILARRDREAELSAALDELARRWQARGYELRPTGPWPPYRFAGLPVMSDE